MAPPPCVRNSGLEVMKCNYPMKGMDSMRVCWHRSTVHTACDCILHYALSAEDSCGRLSGAHLHCQVKALVDGALCTDGREVCVVWDFDCTLSQKHLYKTFYGGQSRWAVEWSAITASGAAGEEEAAATTKPEVAELFEHEEIEAVAAEGEVSLVEKASEGSGHQVDAQRDTRVAPNTSQGAHNQTRKKGHAERAAVVERDEEKAARGKSKSEAAAAAWIKKAEGEDVAAKEGDQAAATKQVEASQAAVSKKAEGEAAKNAAKKAEEAAAAAKEAEEAAASNKAEEAAAAVKKAEDTKWREREAKAKLKALEKAERAVSMSPRRADSMSPRRAESLSPRRADSMSPRRAESLSPRRADGSLDANECRKILQHERTKVVKASAGTHGVKISVTKKSNKWRNKLRELEQLTEKSFPHGAKGEMSPKGDKARSCE